MARAVPPKAHARGEGLHDVGDHGTRSCFCRPADEHIEELKQAWARIGDSIVVVGGDGLWNCHVHTDDIGAAVEAALDLDGRPREIRVTDLFEEVADEHALRDAQLARTASAADRGRAAAASPAPVVAVVAVCSGAGHGRAVRGARRPGHGHRRGDANPSTAELLDAVEQVNAEQVVVLPDNKNIIAVAEQLDALTPSQSCRAHPLDARGPRRGDRLRPRGVAPTRTGRDAPDRRAVATGESPGGARRRHRRAGGRGATGSGSCGGDGVVAAGATW